MPEKKRLFLSSVQKEFAAERAALRDYLRGDPLLRRFFDVFLFEDIPAADRRADEVYLGEVDRCAVYVGLFGHDYGFQDAAGVSPTEREFDRATAQGKLRLIFVKGADDSGRHPKMLALIRRAGDQLIRRRFSGGAELTTALYASLVDYLEQTGLLRAAPFDAAAPAGATLADLDAEKVDGFLARARTTRGYALGPGTPVADALTHLNLLEAGAPSHAALLLFGREPQRWLPTSGVKCLHFHGTEIRKPIPSHHVYRARFSRWSIRRWTSCCPRSIGRSARARRATLCPSPTNCRAKRSPKRSSTPWPIATTRPTPPCRSCFLPIGWRCGIPGSFRHR